MLHMPIVLKFIKGLHHIFLNGLFSFQINASKASVTLTGFDPSP